MASAVSKTTEAPNAGQRGAGTLFHDRIVRIPSDYDTLQEAFDDLSMLPTAQGVTITLNIESGHQPESGLDVADGDYAHFRITSEDDVVQVSDDFSRFVLHGVNCIMPVLACLFDMRGKGNWGYRVISNVSFRIEEGAGVLNAGFNGLTARSGCRGDARFTKWNGAGGDGLRAEQSNLLDVEGAEFNDAARHGIFANHATNMTARLAQARNAGEHGVYSRHLSIVTFFGGDATGAGASDLRIERGGMIDVGNGVYETTNLRGEADAFINQVNTYGLITDLTKPGYEDSGSWIPVLEGGGIAGTQRYRVQEGRYRRIGRTVWIRGRIALSGKSWSMAGRVAIRGLPFAPDELVESGGSLVRMRNIARPSGFLGAGPLLLQPGEDGIELTYNRDDDSAPIASFTAGAITDTTELVFSAVYEAALSELQRIGLQ